MRHFHKKMGQVLSCFRQNTNSIDTNEQYVVALIRLDFKGNTNNVKFTAIYGKKKELSGYASRGQIIDISGEVTRSSYIKLVDEYNEFCRTNVSNVWLCPLDVAKNIFYVMLDGR